MDRRTLEEEDSIKTFFILKLGSKSWKSEESKSSNNTEVIRHSNAYLSVRAGSTLSIWITT